MNKNVEILSDVCQYLSKFDYEFVRVKEIDGKLLIDVKIKMAGGNLNEKTWQVCTEMKQKFPDANINPIFRK